MSIQEVKSDLHLIIDSTDDASLLEQLLDSAKQLLGKQATQLASLADLTDTQHKQLDQAIQDHKQGKTVSHDEMKQRYSEWLNK